MRLKELRFKKDLTKNELAEQIGVSPETISRWENGEEEPSASMVLKLAQFFDCSTDYFLSSPVEIKEQKEEPKREEAETTSSKWTFAKFLFGVIIFIYLIFVACAFADVCSDPNTPNLFVRDATTNDLTITEDGSSIFSYKCTLVPKADIDNLELTLFFYDDNGKLLSKIDKPIGDVKKGLQYQFTLSLTEFKWDSLDDLEKMSVDVQGEVPIFSSCS